MVWRVWQAHREGREIQCAEEGSGHASLHANTRLSDEVSLVSPLGSPSLQIPEHPSTNARRESKGRWNSLITMPTKRPKYSTRRSGWNCSRILLPRWSTKSGTNDPCRLPLPGLARLLQHKDAISEKDFESNSSARKLFRERKRVEERTESNLRSRLVLAPEFAFPRRTNRTCWRHAKNL